MMHELTLEQKQINLQKEINVKCVHCHEKERMLCLNCIKILEKIKENETLAQVKELIKKEIITCKKISDSDPKLVGCLHSLDILRKLKSKIEKLGPV